MKKKRICLLGSTGSIGKNTLEIIRQNADLFSITSIASFGNNIDILKKQIYEFSPN